MVTLLPVVDPRFLHHNREDRVGIIVWVDEDRLEICQFDMHLEKVVGPIHATLVSLHPWSSGFAIDAACFAGHVVFFEQLVELPIYVRVGALLLLSRCLILV